MVVIGMPFDPILLSPYAELCMVHKLLTERHCPPVLMDLDDDLEARIELVGWVSLELRAGPWWHGKAQPPFLCSPGPSCVGRGPVCPYVGAPTYLLKLALLAEITPWPVLWSLCADVGGQ